MEIYIDHKIKNYFDKCYTDQICNFTFCSWTITFVLFYIKIEEIIQSKKSQEQDNANIDKYFFLKMNVPSHLKNIINVVKKIMRLIQYILLDFLMKKNYFYFEVQTKFKKKLEYAIRYNK